MSAAGGVLAAFRMAQQHIALCAPDATVEQALNRAADNVEAMAGALSAFVAAVEDDGEPLSGTRWHREYVAGKAVLSRYHGSAAPAGGGDELPELPPRDCYWRGNDLYTAEQMRDYGEKCRRLASAGSAPAPSAVPEGFALVPVKPTEEMLVFCMGFSDETARRAYDKLLAAAPTPERQR